MQDESTPRFHRPASEHSSARDMLRQPDGLVTRQQIKLHQQIRKGYLRRRAVDDKAHRTIIGMGADIDHGSAEPFIRHTGHGNKQLPIQKSRLSRAFELVELHRCSIARQAGLAKRIITVEGRAFTQMLVVLEPRLGNIVSMHSFIALLLFGLSLGSAIAEGARASAWVEFREARVRLVMLDTGPGETELKGGIEIRLMPDYKTYWRTPGDSGVPPVFDFSTTIGAKDARVAFPLPTRFDDGAGGVAWGYKKDVILPFTMLREDGTSPTVVLKLDFAVCGTMCIPLAAELKLPSQAARVQGVSEMIRLAHTRIPQRLEPETMRKMVRLVRRELGKSAAITLEIDHEAEGFDLFAEAKGHIEVGSVSMAAPGLLHIRLQLQAAPGMEGRFGTALLTFGTKKHALEGVMDLDGLPVAP